MVIGHLGVAFEAKVLRPRPMLWWLIAAAFLPDIVRALLRPFGEGYRLNLLSHSLPAVAIEAVLVATVYRVAGGAIGDAAMLAVVCCTHWPLDFVTGCKATWTGGPVIGMDTYQSPLIDFPLEAALLLAGWSALKRGVALPLSAAARRWVVGGLLAGHAVALALINAHSGGVFFTGGVAWQWRLGESPVLRRIPPPWTGCSRTYQPSP